MRNVLYKKRRPGPGSRARTLGCHKSEDGRMGTVDDASHGGREIGYPLATVGKDLGLAEVEDRVSG